MIFQSHFKAGLETSPKYGKQSDSVEGKYNNCDIAILTINSNIVNKTTSKNCLVCRKQYTCVYFYV